MRLQWDGVQASGTVTQAGKTVAAGVVQRNRGLALKGSEVKQVRTSVPQTGGADGCRPVYRHAGML